MIARFATIVLPRTLDTATQPWRMRLSAAGILGTVLVVSLAAGYHIAATRTLQHEAALAEDIGLPFGEMVAAVELDGQQLAQFAEQPCTNIIDGLTEGGELAPYVSSVFFVKDDRVYCSTALGPVDIPLSVYVPPSHAATQVAMRPGTPRHPQRPAMIVYDRLSGHTGIGFVVPGVYVKDLLVSGTVAGAQSAAVIGSSGNALTNDGEFIESASPRVGRPSYSAPDALFSVSVQGVQAWRARDLVADEGAASLIGLLLGSAVVAGYLTVYTPQRRLVRRVQRGLARGEFFVVYQPIVDVATGQWVGAEALVRWQHPQWGLVMPGQFIGHVENSPVIADLTQFVLKRALTELGAMGLPKGFSLTVNLAAFHASLRGFPSDLGEILAASRTRLQVVFEITERGLLASIDYVCEARVSNSPSMTSAPKTATSRCCSGFISTTSRLTADSSMVSSTTTVRWWKALRFSRDRSGRWWSPRASRSQHSNASWRRSACHWHRDSCLRSPVGPRNSHGALRRQPRIDAMPPGSLHMT
jgi:sensor c-di-GMP phosphodiesterase-like protein